MDFPAYLFIPLACGLLYVVSMLALKRAGDFGVGIWRTTFLANWACALVFLPFWLMHGFAPVPLGAYWQPAVIAVIHEAVGMLKIPGLEPISAQT